MSARFDVLDYMNRLEGVGFSRAQASLMADAFGRALEEKLASKEDLEIVQENLKAEIIKHKLSLQNEIATLELNTIKGFAKSCDERPPTLDQLRAQLAALGFSIQAMANRLIFWQVVTGFILATILATGFGWISF